MLRHLYRCALRLHPPGFRKRFGAEMLSIFDQSKEKRASLRLLLDVAMSLSRQWLLRSEFWGETPAAPAPQPAVDGVPSFCTIDSFHPNPAAFVPALVLSLAIFSLTGVAIKYSWIHVLHIRIPEAQLETPQWIPETTAAPEVGLSGSGQESPALASSESTAALVSPPTAETPKESQSASNPQNPQRRAQSLSNSAKQSATAIAESKTQPETTAVSSTVSGSPAAVSAHNWKLDAAEQLLVIDGAIQNLQKYYVDPSAAQRIAAVLLAHKEHSDYSAITDRQVFANLLTRQIDAAGRDKYIVVVNTTSAVPDRPALPFSEEVARYRKQMAESNCTFEKVQILPHNIGYLKFNSFPDVSICGEVAAAAMKKLNGTDAIIFDLRDNLGGNARMVAFLATYLFDQPTHLNDFYNRGDNNRFESWTLAPVPGNRLTDKPAFVLTSASTFSAAEAFAYDLKMLKRVTLVGETTSGRGHMGAPHSIDEHFMIRIPGILVTNPISKTNWEGKGVEPDVKVNAADAPATAEKLALSSLQKK
jgi:hypothetical protein